MSRVLTSWPPEADGISAAAATVGSFDGVHLGHRRVLEKTVETAREAGGDSLVVSFSNHPLHHLRPEAGLRLLTLTREKSRLLEELGVDVQLLFAFREEFAELTAEEFIAALRELFGLKHFIIGHDSVVGSDRVHDPEELAEICAGHGIEAHRVGTVQVGEVTVSSSLLREYLLVDRLEDFPPLTGRYYSHTGKVRKGRGQGEERLYFPTLNLPVPSVKLTPGDGVYAAWVHMNGEVWPAAVNLMVPKFGLSSDERQELMRLSVEGGPNGSPRLLEAYITDEDFGGKHYGEEVRVELVDKVREELPFEGWEKLREQIERDVEQVEEILEDHPVNPEGRQES